MNLFERLKEFFSVDKKYYKNGFWGSAADVPMFIPTRDLSELENSKDLNSYNEKKDQSI